MIRNDNKDRIIATVNALRCSTRPMSEATNCEGCPYRFLEPARPDLEGFIPDVVVDGKSYYESCDIESMANDAADIIEDLLEGF